MEAVKLVQLLGYLSVAGAILALLAPLVIDLLDRPGTPRASVSPFLWFTGLSLLAGVLSAFGFHTALASDSEIGNVWLAGITGTGVSILSILLCGHVFRSIAVTTLRRYYLCIMTGAGAGSLAGAYALFRHTSRAEDWLICMAAATAVSAAAFIIASSLLSEEIEGSSLVKGAAAGVLASSVTAGICLLGLLIGKMHFDDNSRAGEAVVMLLSIGLGWTSIFMLAAQTIGNGKSAVKYLCWILSVAGAAYLVWLAVQAVGLKLPVAVCMWAGLAVGAIAGLVHVWGLTGTGSRYQNQATFFILAAIISAAALSLREAGGFGAVLMTAGLLAGSLAAICLAGEAEGQSAVAATPLPAIWASTAFLTFAALRIWLTYQGYQEVPIFTPYPFIGLVLGLALPGLFVSITGDAGSPRASTSATSVFGTLFVHFVCLSSVAVVLIILREPAMRMFLVGLAAGILPMWRQLNTATHNSAAAVSASMMTALVALTLATPLMEWTQYLERPEKVKWIAVIAIVTASLYAVFEVARYLTGRKSPAVTS